ncbi:DUF294 nucleotidyltransferase-like domain-containing protein [Paenibacillus sp. ACRRX]|uniref:DUF294 nucleotidyltransferase-like domain-containing protein n=1 Tax=Paenibacillus sp. ACRRX TaxID=2918206 RepID=UPI001EF50561|nr:DUF294 nucleotidyltransferase-like domain-containing protein [Paenibacillus sp. ACRRX]MCG7406051.1 DUF294 nucleotidyltransferase-like domain-containing protein [Paenibacillus sp. ACRRX]
MFDNQNHALSQGEQLAKPWVERIMHNPYTLFEDRIQFWLQVRTEWMASSLVADSDTSSPPLPTDKYLCECQGAQNEQSALMDSSRISATARYEMVTLIIDAFYQAAALQVETLLRQNGCGSPPAAYACVLFGSGGRREMTPWSDQDHGLLWADVPADQQAGAAIYFDKWGSVYTKLLARLGFPPCSGKVLASEAEWRGSISEWRQRIECWTQHLNWENMRYFSMSLDMRTCFGETCLEQQWRAHLQQIHEQHGYELNKAIVSNLLHRKRAHNTFGQLICERYGVNAGLFDIKYRAYVPIAQLARSSMWISGRLNRSMATRERLQTAIAIAHLLDDVSIKAAVSEVYQWWDDVLLSRWQAGGYQADGWWNCSGMVDPAVLPPARKMALKQNSHAITKWLRHLERRYTNEK